MTQQAVSLKSFSRASVRASLVLCATLGLSACSAGDLASGAISTASVPEAAPAQESIDPTYAPAPDVAEAERDEVFEEYVREAADVAMRDDQSYGATAHLSWLHQRNPGDKKIAFDLARHLRYIGAVTEAEQILNQALATHPDDLLLRLELGKVRVAAGRGEAALEMLEPLRAERPQDPAILQATGLAYDRLKRHEEAQQAYAEAVALGTPSAALLNNYGLSYLLAGDAEQAVLMLSQASVQPGAGQQVRQNLAMALTMAGREADARRVAASASDDDSAAASVAFFESLKTTTGASVAADGGLGDG